MKENKQMTIHDLYNIFLAHAKDDNLKEMNLVMLDSTTAFGATMHFNDAVHDKEGRKSMQKLVERINQFYLKIYE